MRRRSTQVAAVALTTLTLALAGCGTKGSTSSSGGSSGAGGVKTGPGVTGDTITLGDLTDLHGVFAALGKSITNANQLYWDQQNAKGGVCGRKIKIVVKDHGYDVQQAVTLYQQIKDQVLSLQQTLGSPINTALLANFTSDKMLSIPSAWASTLLKNDQIMIVGSTYDYEMIDGVDYLIQQGKLASGDKIGHIYFEGEYGSNGLAGSKFAAEKNNITVIEQKIKATDNDVTAQITNLKSAGAKAILLTAGPKQSASAAGVAASIGYNVPILSNNPGFAPGLMATAAGAALASNFYILGAWTQPASTSSAVQQINQAYQKAYPGAPLDGGVTWGYGAAQAYNQVLQKACDNKDLTRDGINAAFRSLSNVDTGGVIEPLDYSKKGAAPTQKVLIFRPDNSVEGKLKQVEQDYVGKDAGGYVPPALKS